MLTDEQLVRLSKTTHSTDVPSRLIREMAVELYRTRGLLSRSNKLLREAADDIRCDIENRYPPNTRGYPSEARRYKNEMDFVNRMEEALAGTKE
jgi:hypothetical protein